MKSVRLVPRAAAARSIRPRSSARMRIFSVSRGRALGLLAVLMVVKIARRNDVVITPANSPIGTGTTRTRRPRNRGLLGKFARPAKASGAVGQWFHPSGCSTPPGVPLLRVFRCVPMRPDASRCVPMHPVSNVLAVANATSAVATDPYLNPDHRTLEKKPAKAERATTVSRFAERRSFSKR